MESRLRRELDRVDGRLSTLNREQVSTGTWLAFALAGLVLLVSGVRFERGLTIGLVIGAAVVMLLIRGYMAKRRVGPHGVANLLQRERDLGTSLSAAVELEPDLPDGRYGFLATRLVDEVLVDSRRGAWTSIVPDGSLRGARLMHIVGAFTCIVIATLIASPRSVESAPSNLTEGVLDAVPESSSALVVNVVPGDCEVERGRSVLITAEFSGGAPPADTELVLLTGDAVQKRASLTQSLDDPVFAGRIENVQSDLEYRIEWPGEESSKFTVSVFELPRLERSDITLEFPVYTGRESRRIEDTRRVTAPRGTTLGFELTLNKPVEAARLRSLDRDAAEGDDLELTPDPADPRRVLASLVLEGPRRYELLLLDDAGRTNKTPPTFIVRMTENQRPELRLTKAPEARVSPLQELELAADVTDDFGLARVGVGYRVGGKAFDIVLSEARDTLERASEALHTLLLEELEAQPAQLVSYHFWAEDLGVDGEPRRTRSDLYFAEVRSFEEIFREAEQAAGGEGQQQQQQEQGQQGEQDQQPDPARLAEMQRDVILATWNVIRRSEAGDGDLQEDAEVVRDAQAEALSQLDAVEGAAQMLGVEDAADVLPLVREAMESALEELTRAVEEGSLPALDEALPHEQAAYEGLSQLRPDEFQVSRGQPQSAQSSSRANSQSGPSQQQLQQLELTNSENRYETQRQADQAGQASQAERETRDAQSRLKELAQRQSDVNERVRELQSELEAAETEEEREELQRRLERLQEQQEEILRDTDEVQQNLDESSQAQRLTQEREQLEQARENVRRAAEALEEGELSEALTEGSRASRDLEELEQDLRDAAGGQFEERMRDMQAEARRIEEQQQRLAEGLEELSTGDRRSLSESPEREQLEQDLEAQAGDLDQLLDAMEQAVLDAEENEPLLAEELFETLGEARGEELTDSIERAQNLLERGFPLQAEAAEREAGPGVTRLREGVEDAAERLLGSGEEALSRAADELERLSEELDSELARARGEAEPQQGAAPEGEPQEGQPGEGQPGEGQPGEGQPGEGQPGEGQPGEGQPGEGQPGEGQPGEGQPGEGQPGRGEPRAGVPRQRRSLTEPDSPQQSGADQRGGRGGRSDPAAPLTGDDFRDWNQRLREVEELIEDPELASEAARLRSRARTVREEFKRHSEEPNWELVDEKIARPLSELQRKVAEEARRRRADDQNVPIDRDPVPPEFSEAVRKYYERLGRGK